MRTASRNAARRVTLATGIPRRLPNGSTWATAIPQSIRPEDFADREDEGVLLVPKAGEMLFQLERPPAWAGGGEG